MNADLSETSLPGARPQRMVVGITGASGVILGIRLLEVLKPMEIETHQVISPAGRVTIAQETSRTLSEIHELADVYYSDKDIAAAVASGSFATLGMVVIPCSIKTLSAIANSYSADLMSRAADVTLKEGRPLLLVVREPPRHPGHLRLMTQAAEAADSATMTCTSCAMRKASGSGVPTTRSMQCSPRPMAPSS